jgi:3-hydroxyisobutyrate dehydrogenase
MARTGEDGPKGISTLVVPKDAPGLSFGALENKMGWHMQPTRQVIFEDCKVPAENLLSGEGAGFRIAMAGLDGGRLNIAACSLGGAQAALDKALGYTAERKAFGQTLDRFQALQFRLADMETELQAARIFLYAAASKLDRKAPDASKWSAMAKRFVTDAGFDIANDALQLLRGLRLPARLRRGEAGARPARPPDPRRHQRDHARHHRAAFDRTVAMTTIAFIGLGNMGNPMAANLVKAGFAVRGFDLVVANLDTARSPTASPSHQARSRLCRTLMAVITMLPAGKHVLAVYADIAPAAKSGTLFIDSSTIDVESARKAHEIAAGHGLLSVDAPVSGGTGGAAAGTLTFMAGGSQESFTKAEPVLEPMAGRIVHCGEAGAGQAAKICNNMILGISMIGVGEAFVLAEKLGLSHQALFDVASTSSGQCWSLTSYCPVPGPVPTSPANRDYRPGFAAALMLKDLKLSQEAAQAAGAVTPLGAEATQLYALFNATGNGDVDFSGIVNFLRGKTAPVAT